MDICICIIDSLCCIPETNAISQVNYTPIKLKKIIIIKFINEEKNKRNHLLGISFWLWVKDLAFSL